MQAVPELVGQRQRVAQLAREIHQHVRVVMRSDRHAVGASRLARHHRRVDPAVRKELFDQLSGPR